jgi:hypothetical protein
MAERQQMPDLTPEQLVTLYRMGLTPFGTPDTQRAGGGLGPFSVGVSGSKKGDYQTGTTYANASVPIGPARASGGVAVAKGSRGGPAVVPNVSLNLGPVNANASQVYADGQNVANSYGAGITLDDIILAYQRSQPVQGYGSNSYSITAPVGDARVSASATQGRQQPTQYAGGVTVPGLLGGNLMVGGEYTPESKDKAFYARYKRSF